MIGALVKQRRERRGWTQTELALETGLRQVYISQVESGQIRVPRDHNLAAVARALPHLAGMEPGDQNAILRELVDRVVLDRADRRIIWRAETLALFAVA